MKHKVEPGSGYNTLPERVIRDDKRRLFALAQQNKTSQTREVTTAKNRGHIGAGWLVIGNLKDKLLHLAHDHDVDITLTQSTGLLGRTVYYTVEGEQKKVDAFCWDATHPRLIGL